jgi:hypothetical protein
LYFGFRWLVICLHRDKKVVPVSLCVFVRRFIGEMRKRSGLSTWSITWISFSWSYSSSVCAPLGAYNPLMILQPREAFHDSWLPFRWRSEKNDGQDIRQLGMNFICVPEVGKSDIWPFTLNWKPRKMWGPSWQKLLLCFVLALAYWINPEGDFVLWDQQT